MRVSVLKAVVLSDCTFEVHGSICCFEREHIYVSQCQQLLFSRVSFRCTHQSTPTQTLLSSGDEKSARDSAIALTHRTRCESKTLSERQREGERKRPPPTARQEFKSRAAPSWTTRICTMSCMGTTMTTPCPPSQPPLPPQKALGRVFFGSVGFHYELQPGQQLWDLQQPGQQLYNRSLMR